MICDMMCVSLENRLVFVMSFWTITMEKVVDRIYFCHLFVCSPLTTHSNADFLAECLASMAHTNTPRCPPPPPLQKGQPNQRLGPCLVGACSFFSFLVFPERNLSV